MAKKTAKILDGKKLSAEIALELSKKVALLASEQNFKPKLVIIQVGDLAESNTYIKNKIIFAQKIGVDVVHKKYTIDSTNLSREIISDIKSYNSDPKVTGIIVQLPIPASLDQGAILEAIDPKKDVDGMSPRNVKFLYENKEQFLPATTKGILLLLEKNKITIKGKKVVVVGQSFLVGKPTALAMLNRGATVTVCHNQTKNLEKETKTADILIVAVGKPKLITKRHVSPGQVVVDIGINVSKKGKIVGDVDFDNVAKVVRAVTPVPGGVGPMTIVSLFENLLATSRLG